MRALSGKDDILLLLEGCALCSHLLDNGSQQHLAFAAPSDLLDLAGFVVGRSNVRLRALTDCVAAGLSRPDFERLSSKHPAFATQVRRELAVSVRATQERLVSLGRRSAFARLAHLFCELEGRFGRPQDDADIELPLTQTDLSDLLGLSVVHTSRMLQRMRRQGLVELPRGRLRVLDQAGLRSTARFEADGGLSAAAS